MFVHGLCLYNFCKIKSMSLKGSNKEITHLIMLKTTATINNNKNCVLFRHYAVL